MFARASANTLLRARPHGPSRQGPRPSRQDERLLRPGAARAPLARVVGRQLDVPRVAVGPDADGSEAAQRDGEGCRRFHKVQQ